FFFERDKSLLPRRLALLELGRRVVQLLLVFLDFRINFIAFLGLFGSRQVELLFGEVLGISEDRVIKELYHLIELLLGERVVLMVVALSATDAGPQEHGPDRARAINLRIPVILFPIRAAFG